MAEKKTTKKAAAVKAEEPKKATVKKAAAPKKVAEKKVAVNAENAGFKAGDVYQALAAAGKALTVKEIAKAAKISEEETLLGLGWLFKEDKLAAADEKITLA
jgi:transcription initiation factor TFIIIB Brf1 subunit/transcription initiation factor TFIIB